MSKSNNISTNRTAIDDIAILRDDELDAIVGGVGKTIGGKAKIIDGRFSIPSGIILTR